jgi:hypothetical protein
MAHVVLVTLEPQIVLKNGLPWGKSYNPTLQMMEVDAEQLLDYLDTWAVAPNPAYAVAIRNDEAEALAIMERVKKKLPGIDKAIDRAPAGERLREARRHLGIESPEMFLNYNNRIGLPRADARPRN